MPWRTASTMSLRFEFVHLAMADGANVRQLCRRFGISARTAYKWIHRYHEGGAEALEDRSRRPHVSPAQTSSKIEQRIVRLREVHPAWGPRKLRVRLLSHGYADLPSISTIAAILRRNGCVDPSQASKHQPYQRFEAAGPNRLWQMDFKGDFALPNGRCHPLTVLDDYSRYSVALYACADQTERTVQTHLTNIFRRYGLPQRILTDNGGPWGTCGAGTFSSMGVWFLRLGISLSHSRVCHPQTLGKEERFHRTLKAEVIAERSFTSLDDCQQHFDRWRDVYNFERPHQALEMAVPASRYQASVRHFPETLPSIDYGPDDLVRKVSDQGEISFRGKLFKLGRAFYGYPVALRPTLDDGLYHVFFCHQQIAQIDLKKANLKS